MATKPKRGIDPWEMELEIAAMKAQEDAFFAKLDFITRMQSHNYRCLVATMLNPNLFKPEPWYRRVWKKLLSWL